FKHVLTITPETLVMHTPVIWHQQLSVPAGLYQVRVAVREREHGWTGSANQWISIPDLTQQGLKMSSLFVGSRESTSQETTAAPQAIKVSVDRKFTSSSVLRFQTYIYHAATRVASANSSNVEVTAEIIRN